MAKSEIRQGHEEERGGIVEGGLKCLYFRVVDWSDEMQLAAGTSEIR